MTVITEQKAEIEARIRSAALAAGRDPAAIRILGVSKRQSRERIVAAIAAGITDLGENYLQEATAKITDFGAGPRWHFIGKIQSNKTRAIAEQFDWVQTVASDRIARRLSAHRPHHGRPLQVCIQVAPRGDDNRERGGAGPADVPALAALIESLPQLDLRGLMVMPLFDLSAAELAAEFRAGRALFDELRAAGHDLDTLSMGMSGDLETAVAEGSTMVRIGTALFGPRQDS